MLPFLSAVKLPDVLLVVWNVRLFEADGFLPPPFTHSYATVSVAEQAMVSVEPDARPASLNEQTRLAPLIEALVAFLMKCGLPAKADATKTSATNDRAPAKPAKRYRIGSSPISAEHLERTGAPRPYPVQAKPQPPTTGGVFQPGCGIARPLYVRPAR